MVLPNSSDPSLYVPRMPAVDRSASAQIEKVFRQARNSAAEDTTPGKGNTRHVVIVTPGRMLMVQACPAPGSMKPEHVQPLEKFMSSQIRQNIAVIAYTDLEALRASVGRSIPFYGLLIGLAYIGHAVWVFEGHASALAAGCRQADLLIVDDAMLPFLQPDWLAVASAAMRRPLIVAHERATFTLKQLAGKQ